MFVDIITVFTL